MSKWTPAKTSIGWKMTRTVPEKYCIEVRPIKWWERIWWFDTILARRITTGFWIILACVLVSGCTVIDYGNFHYRSLGGVAFDRLEAVKDGNDILVDVTMYKKESIGDVAGKVAEGVARGLK